MLSYRKSQQVSLTEKLKKKNVIHAFGVSGSGTTMARLYHSAFARRSGSGLPSRIFATAHSCGLRRTCGGLSIETHSLPQRIRAGCDDHLHIPAATVKDFAAAHSCGLRRCIKQQAPSVCVLCHSAFARVATMAKSSQYLSPTLCHSAFARVATKRAILITVRQDLCHSAFARVTTFKKSK